MEIGQRIRKIRTQQKRTLQEIAEVCQCSKALLSKIENGKVIPAVATLSNIAKSLGVKVSALLEEDNHDSAAFTSNMLSNPDAFITTSKGYSLFAYAPHFTDKKMQPLLIWDKKGEVKSHIVSHPGEEFIYVLEGEVRITIGNLQYHLKMGESIYFASSLEHGVMPETATAKYLDIFVE